MSSSVSIFRSRRPLDQTTVVEVSVNMNTEANVSKAADVEENLCNKIKEMCKISEDQGVRLKKIEENNNLASSLNKLIDMMRKRRARNRKFFCSLHTNYVFREIFD